jgi:glycosyltransferase involved in cell wall biosynthesis
MKILYLYSEIMGYQIPVLKELVRTYSAQVTVVHWDYRKLTPYTPAQMEGVTFYKRSTFDQKTLVEFVVELAPDITYVSGWQDRGYLPAVHQLKKTGVPVVVAFDDQWKGSVRQRIGSLLLRGFFKKRYFSHAWVAGPWQYEYARRMGFHKNETIFNLLCADVTIFNDAYHQRKRVAGDKYPHRFLFVGRFEKIKGVDLLAEAWHSLGDQRRDWQLHFIGNGSLESHLRSQKDVTVHAFMLPDELRTNISAAGCFVLPSRGEPWGVVIHEAAAAGLPILCSDVCGAAPTFLIPGWNGFKFKAGDIGSLREQMLRIIGAEDAELHRMSECSHQLGQHITPATSAASLIALAGTWRHQPAG